MNDMNMTRFIPLTFDMRDLYEFPSPRIEYLVFGSHLVCLEILTRFLELKNKIKLFSRCFIL